MIRRDQAGFSILEMTVSMAVVSVVALASLSMTVSTATLEAANRETATATAVARDVVEEVMATDFEDIFYSFNNDEADDPDGPGTALGGAFVAAAGEQSTVFLPSCNSINPTYTMAEVPPESERLDINVSIGFPVNGAGRLREGQALFEGAPVDLDQDGDVNPGTDHAGSYTVLPMMIELQWNGVTGARTLRIPRILTKRDE